ncbi:MAG: AAA family ATPase [Bacteroidetes bacterium]|nr:AAA family ATPase [Bacteroidota bacterium]
MSQVQGFKLLDTIYESESVIISRATRLSDNATVTIKSFKANYPSLKDLAKLKHELDITSTLDSDSVVKSISIEKAGNGLALIRENFDADILEDTIEDGMAVETFLPLAIQIADAVGHLHHNNIIHKDIKPSNILISKDGKKVKLTDFGISSKLSRETQNISNPGKLEGSLAFMSPEQTGRMNRAIDYRSDFYSLGITFYKMLTGKLPFQYADPMEMVHAHIAIQPDAVNVVNKNIPAALAAIITKLISKTAEERYRSASGLKADLEECLSQWQNNKKIDSFVLGSMEVSENFHISQKLYGREQEINNLLSVFESVSDGEARLMLVSGYSGTGKSALVSEIHKPIVRQKGYFISGKFDQFKRNVPYDSLIQAFRELTRQLLTESEEKISTWKEKLLTALGPNGQLIIDVIPETELIMGKQPAVAPLPPSESQNRFNSVLQSFISVFTSKKHPLVIFLDDLQWADSGSLKLIKNLILDSATEYLYLIGAYRDNEVDSTHPLTAIIEDIAKAGKEVNTITVKPLSEENINQLISDSLFHTPESTAELTRLVYSKTHGNPFFVIEFLKMLYQENLLFFDIKDRSWKWDVQKIWEKETTDNVVVLMTDKILSLETESQEILKLAACIGNQFSLATLSLVNETSTSVVNKLLWEAMREGLIIPLDQDYRLANDENYDASAILFRFKHDRIQQAAYALLNEESRRASHLKIGRLMMANTAEDQMDDNLFDIVNQYNEGVFGDDQEAKAEGVSADELSKLASLNFKAGAKAKGSTAYEAGFRYFETAKKLLPANHWESQYEFSFNTYLESAECAYLLGNHSEAENNFEIILGYAKDVLDKAKVYYLKITLYTTIFNFQGAMETGNLALELFGEAMPENIDEAMGIEIGKVMVNPVLGDMDAILNLPELTDPIKIELARLIGVLQTPAYYTNTNLWTYLVTKQMDFALTHGNSPIAPMGYLGFALILGNAIGNFDGADKLGLIALKLNDRYQGKENLAKLHMVHYTMNNHYKHHVRTNIPEAKVALQYAMETGDLLYCHFCIIHIAAALMYKNAPVEEILSEITRYEEFFKRMPNEMSDVLVFYRQICLAFKGETLDAINLSSEIFNEDEFHTKLTKNLNPLPLFYYDMIKMQHLYIHGKYGEAIALSGEAEKVITFSYANFVFTEFFYINALTLAALYPYVDDEKKAEFNTNMDVLQAKMKVLSDACPENYMHKYVFVEAERAKNLGDKEKAVELYTQAISFANDNEFVLDSALINEKFGEYHLSLGDEETAKGFIRDAHYFYKQWGAKTKTTDLETKYPNLIVRRREDKNRTHDTTASYTTTTTGESSSLLDLASVMKSAQALSSEVDIAALLKKVTTIMIENVGAENGVLILEQNGKWVIQSEAKAGEDATNVMGAVPVTDSNSVCNAIINYVARTKKYLVIEDAIKEGNYMLDEYVVKNKIRSVLCAPIFHHSKMTGILYFENNLTADAFTQDRIDVLNLLSSQAAISIENAKLYSDLKGEIDERKRAQDALQENEQKLAQYLEAVPVGIFVLNKDGHPHYANENAKKLLGKGIIPTTTAEHISEVYSAFKRGTKDEYPPQDVPVVRALSGESITIDDMVIIRDGKETPLEVSASQIYDANGNIIFAIAAFQDITQRLLAKKQLEEYNHTLELRVAERTSELNEKKEALEEAIDDLKLTQNKLVQSEKLASLGQLTAGIAHEIQNPLNFVNNFSELSSEMVGEIKVEMEKFNGKVDEKDIEYVNDILDDLNRNVSKINEHGKRADAIVKGMLMHSRSDKGEKQPEDINYLVDEYTTLTTQSVRDNNEVSIEVERDLDKSIELLEINGQDISRVLVNILNNAFYAAKDRREKEQNGFKPKVTVRTINKENTIEIKVRDNGKGVPVDIQDKIFNPFFTTKPTGEGTGLGLSLSYDIIVHGHGGELKLDTQPNNYTEFTIVLPKVKKETLA